MTLDDRFQTVAAVLGGLCVSLVVGIAGALAADAAADDFVLVKAGRTADDNGGIVLPYDLLVGRHEVTFDEFDAFCRDTGRKPLLGGRSPGRGRLPAVNVSWTDAVEYCNWKSEKAGLPPAYAKQADAPGGYSLTNLPENLAGYRLPTGSEWEYAARGGASGRPTVYSGSDDLNEVGWFNGNAESVPHPVGTRAANELGLHDMTGNVSEWVNTRTHFLAHPEAKQHRSHRGGSWYVSDKPCRVAFKHYDEPKKKIDAIGFRVVQTVLAAPAVGSAARTTKHRRADVGNSRNTVILLALATKAESDPERIDIARDAVRMIQPDGPINLTKETDLFDFINDPGPAGYKFRGMPADRHLVLDSLTGPVTKRELDGLRDNYLAYDNPTTNWGNYHFRRWYVPFMGEWIYDHVGPADKIRVLDKMIDMGRSVLAHRNDRFGKFVTQFGDVTPAWPHYRWARITTEQYLEQPLGISDFGFTSWATMPAKIIAADPQLWSKTYQGKTYREIADELIADSLVTVNACIKWFLDRDMMLYMPSDEVQPLEGNNRIPGWNRAFKFMVSTLPLIDALEKLDREPETRRLLDAANASMIDEFWKYVRPRTVNGKTVYDYPGRLDRYASTDIGHAGFDSNCLQEFFRAGRYGISREQVEAYANTLAEVSCMGDGMFRHRFEGGEATISPGLEGLEGLLFYAAYRPELFKLLVEHTWNTLCKGGEAPDSRVVWEILKLKEKGK